MATKNWKLLRASSEQKASHKSWWRIALLLALAIAFLPSATANAQSSTSADDDDDPLTALLKDMQRNGSKRSTASLRKIRHRVPGYYEKQHKRNLESLAPAAAEALKSTFEVVSEDYWVSMGMVVTADGYAVTKASELGKVKKVRCRFSDSWVDAVVQKVDRSNDIALLKLSPGNYQPAKLASADPEAGTILLTPGIRKKVMAMGVCSVPSRSLRGQGFLGVDPAEKDGGIYVKLASDAAARAGIRRGDLITAIDGTKVQRLDQFVNLIRLADSGGTLEIDLLRQGQPVNVSVTLGYRDSTNRLAKRFEAMDLLGTIKSSRSGRFPWVFQHDTALLPEHCGGPVVDIQGRVVGMNISRGGRIRSYGIGNQWLKKVLKNWKITPAQG